MKNRNLYPDNWNDTIRPAVLKRDNYKCVLCGVAHRARGYYDQNKKFIVCDEFMENWAIRNGKKIQQIHLQAMHINHDKSDCSLENLKAGCPKCHLEHDRPINMLKRKMKGRQGGTGGGASHIL